MSDGRDVVIVGAGPVGLLLANILGAADIRGLLVDRRIGLPSQSRAIGVTPPSLHILEQCGVATALIAAGVRVQDAVVSDGRQLLGTVSFRDLPGPYPFILSVPQRETMRLLELNLLKYPSIAYLPHTEFLGMDRNGGFVKARIRDRVTSMAQSVQTRLVLGCDGHRSAVREACGLHCAHKRYGVAFLMADFDDTSDLGATAHLFFTPQGAIESFPLPGRRRRWVAQVDQGAGQYSYDDIARPVRERTGFDLCISGASKVSWFQPERLCCKPFGGPSVLLCGDAAHVMSPIGGQGMNTGFADAAEAARVVTDHLNGGNWEDLCAGYSRRRRQAFETAANRAAIGMWIGTRQGMVGRIRGFFLKHGLLRNPFSRGLPQHFAMLTIPHVEWPFHPNSKRAR